MPTYSNSSKAKLAQCDNRLQYVFNTAIQYRDCTITEGHRDQATQNLYFAQGKSKEQWPNGKHNSTPSKAVDAAPFINGAISYEYADCVCFAGFVLGVAAMLGVKLRWGGSWNMDWLLKENKFNDLVHYEILE